MASKKKSPDAPKTGQFDAEAPTEPDKTPSESVEVKVDADAPHGLNAHPHVGMTCRYTNAGGYVRAAIVEGVDADGYRLAVFDPIERCVRHEHGVSAESIAPVGA
jgi:hypothetical protein